MKSPWLPIHCYKTWSCAILQRPHYISSSILMKALTLPSSEHKKTVLMRFFFFFLHSVFLVWLLSLVKTCMSVILFGTFTKLTSNIELRHNSNVNSDLTSASKLLLNIQSCTPVIKEAKYQFFLRTQYLFSKEIITSPKVLFLHTVMELYKL